MMRLNQLLQPFRQDMGVNLGRRDIGMSEQFLQAAQIGAMRQQMRGEGMTEHMRREAGGVEIRFAGGDLQLYVTCNFLCHFFSS